MYVDLGEDYFEKQKAQAINWHSLRILESLKYAVTFKKPEAPRSSQIIFPTTNYLGAFLFF